MLSISTVYYKFVFCDEDIKCLGTIEWEQFSKIVRDEYYRIRLPHDSEKLSFLKQLPQRKSIIQSKFGSCIDLDQKLDVKARIHELAWNDNYIYLWLEFKGKNLKQMQDFLYKC